MQIAIALFDRMTALDAIGPYEVLSRLPGADVRFVASESGPKRCDTGALALVADYALEEVPSPDVVVVPGGEGTRGPEGAELIDWIRAAHETSRWTTSVCTGSLLARCRRCPRRASSDLALALPRPPVASTAPSRRASAWSSRARS